MGVMPIRRLLLTMSGPMMVSMLIQALYNVVDSMFVSYISEGALTAVSPGLPHAKPNDRRGHGHGCGRQCSSLPKLGGEEL